MQVLARDQDAIFLKVPFPQLSNYARFMKKTGADIGLLTTTFREIGFKENIAIHFCVLIVKDETQQLIA